MLTTYLISFVTFILLSVYGSVFAVNELDQAVNQVYNNEEERLENIDFDIQNYTREYYQQQEVIENLEQYITPLKEEAASLQSQLDIIDEQITRASTKIDNISIQVNQKRLEIAKLQEALERTEIEREEEKKLVLEFIKQIYLDEKKYFSDYTATPELIKLLLSDDSVSGSLQNLEFLKVVQLLSQNIFHRLEEANALFEKEKQELEEQTRSLNALKFTLEQEKTNLLAQRSGKEKLLEQTAGKEAEYQKLIAESKKQEEEALLAIANLRENRSSIESQLSTFDPSASSSQAQKEALKKVLDNPIIADKYNLSKLISDIKITAPLLWPVSPDQGISAYFDDASYRKYFGVDHGAIDIPIGQGSSIFAPASAYVEKIQDNGYGYSYIVLAHKDGLSTLYGHVSEILVEEGELIQMGKIIGKTGGTPGTLGAGARTTGPHLHFEVFEDGVAKDPLNFLPLELLPKKFRR